MIKKENKSNNLETKPVIIRREVIVNNDETKPFDQNRRNKDNSVNRNRNTNRQNNGMHRNRKTKPKNISDFFGLSKKEEPPKKETVQKTQKPVENKTTEQKPNPVKNVKPEAKPKQAPTQKPVKNVEQRKVEKNTEPVVKKINPVQKNTGRNEQRQPQNKNKFQNGQRQNQFGNNRNRNSNNNNNNNYNNSNNNGQRNNNGNRNGVRNSNQSNYNQDNKSYVEKPSIDSVFQGKDKQKDFTRSNDKKFQNKNRYDENKKKKNSKHGNNQDFDARKIKDLKSQKNLTNMFDDQEGGMLDYYDLTTSRGKRNKKAKKVEQESKQKIFQLTNINIGDTISVKDLATELKKTSSEIIKKLFDYGIMATINQEIDFDTAFLVAQEFGVSATKVTVQTEEDILFDESEDKEEDLVERAPVVVVMGHVDHGKTSLLDTIKKTNVIEGEAGGITQHIGAYKVKVKDKEITFLDTPGHEAFTAMRARGAQITDIAILVVAANDGVMPQTVEAINHAKAAGIPIIVAINKIDLPDANIERVKEEMMKYELVPEEWGGDTIYVPISAKNNENIDTLLEMVLLQAEMLELKVNPNKQAKGVVIESRLDKSKGPIATLLIQRGKLDVGDTIVVGQSIGHIRAMINDKGKKIKSAGPSTPVSITGLSEVPEGGETFYEVDNEKMAKHLIERRKRTAREQKIKEQNVVTIENFYEKMKEEEFKILNLIIKADVQGSVEALKQSLEKIQNEEVKVKIIHAAAGAVNQSDVTLAKVSNAIIIAFNVRPDSVAADIAKKDKVEIKQYSVIYQAIEDIENAIHGMLAPKYQEKVIGNMEVRDIFKMSTVGTIGGCFVLSGKVERHANVRVIRENILLFDGKLSSLKRFKDDVKEVSKGFECGITIEGYNDIKVGDNIEVYVMEEIKR